MSRLVVAIPAYNEEETLAKVIAGLRKTLIGERDALVLVVDDGSTDMTAKIAVDSGADVVLSHIRNQGVALAYRTAIHYSVKLGADVVCTIDADGQFDSGDLFNLVDIVRTGRADIVIGSRLADHRNLRRIPTMNLITNKLMAVFVSIAAGTRIHDAESGYRAMNRSAALSLDLVGLVSFSHDMIIDLARKGFRICEVPVVVKYYQGRTSRVIGGFLKYGIRASAAIVVKLLVLIGLFKSIVRGPVRTRMVFVGPAASSSSE